MFLKSRKAILQMVQQLTESQPATQPLRIAVAFWGDGAETLVSSEKQYQIVCSLLRGGTNPSAIRALRAMPNVEIRHLTNLHAKVVIAHCHAIVGSANFSADGLGYKDESSTGWLEAAAVVDGATVQEWFKDLWKTADEVSEDDLKQATTAWTARFSLPRLGASEDLTSLAVQLLESELFKPTITGGNMIRMADRHIESIYFEEIEPESKRSVWNPAYASSLLWTAAGNRIETKINHCRYFEHPSDVLVRAKYPKTIEKVHRFVDVLSRHPRVSPAVRYWATRYLRTLS